MSALHQWHRETFTKRTDVTLVWPARSTMFGGTFPEVRKDVKLGTARAVICQRTVNALSPEEWKHAQAAFDDSDEGKALEDKDAGTRREHCELWLLKRLHEADHPEMVAPTELALFSVLEHHAQRSKMDLHMERVVAHVKDGEPLAPEAVKS